VNGAELAIDGGASALPGDARPRRGGAA
jgi:hypothetical protein